MLIDTDTAEGKAELQKLIDAETKGLKEKNVELLGEVKKQKETMKDIQTQLDDIKAAKDEAEAAAAAKSGDVDKVKASIEAKYKKDMSVLEAKLSGAQTLLHKQLVDGGLTDALTKSGVAPQYLDAAKALIQSQNKAEIADVDGAPVARIGGEAISDFVTKWAQGDHGKHFVAAPNNGGGGASGSNGNGKAVFARQIKESEFNAMAPKDRAAAMKDGKTQIIPN